MRMDVLAGNGPALGPCAKDQRPLCGRLRKMTISAA